MLAPTTVAYVGTVNVQVPVGMTVPFAWPGLSTMIPVGAAAVSSGGLAFTNSPLTGPLFTNAAQKVPFVLVVSVSPGQDVAPAVGGPGQSGQAPRAGWAAGGPVGARCGLLLLGEAGRI